MPQEQEAPFWKFWGDDDQSQPMQEQAGDDSFDYYGKKLMPWAYEQRSDEEQAIPKKKREGCCPVTVAMVLAMIGQLVLLKMH